MFQVDKGLCSTVGGKVPEKLPAKVTDNSKDWEVGMLQLQGKLALAVSGP